MYQILEIGRDESVDVEVPWFEAHLINPCVEKCRNVPRIIDF